MRVKSRALGTLSQQRALFALALSFLGAVRLYADAPATKIFWGEQQSLTSDDGAVWSFTDLDGDLLRDSVRSSRSGLDRTGYVYTVEFKMSAGALPSSIRVHGPDAWGLDITPRDVDGDRDLDLVVTGGVFRRPLGVWINDGHGRFAPAEISQFPAWIWLEERSFHAPKAQPAGDATAVLSNSTSVAAETEHQGHLFCAVLGLPKQSDLPLWDHFLTDGSRPRAPPVSKRAS